MDQNALVERAIRFNRLLSPDQLAQAKAELAMRPDKPLLQILLDKGFLRDSDVKTINDMIEQGLTRPPLTPRAGAAAAAPPPPAAPASSDTLRLPEKPASAPAAAGAPRLTVSDMLRMTDRTPAAAPPAPPAAPPAAAAPAPAAPPRAPAAGSTLRLAPDDPPRPPEPPVAEPVTASVTSEFDTARIAAFLDIDDYLKFAREIGASDLHISVNCPPMVRRHGRLISLPREPFEPHETRALLFRLLSSAQEAEIEEKLAIDFCCDVANQGRYRSCIAKQRLGWDGAFRIIPAHLPTFAELGLPDQLRRLTEFSQGLVLVTGPIGCGKSTTMAAMVELINQARSDHIITLEDPIEYIIEGKGCQITQRESATHTKSFANALRAALREDPDVIVVGEMRDLETVSLAITAAETGHLVFGTLHTTSAARTIDRVLDVFPADEQNQIRNMVSESLRGVVCQQLVPKKDGSGRVVALEVLFNTPAVANVIRERKIFQIPSLLQTGRKQGMMLLDVSLQELVNQNVIDGVDAYYAADNKATFAKFAPKLSATPTATPGN